MTPNPAPSSNNSGPTIVNGTVGFGFGGWSWAAAFIFLLGIVMAISGRPLYSKYKAHHAKGVAAKAMIAINEERWEAASQLLSTELPGNQNQPALLRAMAELFLQAYGDAQMAVTPLRQLLASGAATPDDMRRCAEALTLTGDTTEAKRIYDTLPTAERDSRKGLELLANITREAGHPEEAMRLLRTALQRDATDPDCQLRLAILYEGNSLDASKQHAAEAIWKIAHRQDRFALAAIAHLATNSPLTATEIVELRTLVDAHPLATDRDRYRVLHAYLIYRPLERRALIASEMQRNQGKAPEALFDFLRWLGTEKEAAAILTILPKQTAIRDADIFLVYVDALSAAERWAELRDIMKNEKVQVSKATANYVLAQCYANLEPDHYKARQYILATYGNATARAENEIIFRTAGLAENLGIFDLARQGYLRVAETKPRNIVTIVEKLHELAAREKDIPAMFTTLRKLRELRPGNQSYTDRLNYLRLVIGLEQEEAWKTILGYDGAPASTLTSSAVPPALLRALAAYRLGQMERMATEVKSIATATQLPAGQRAILAGMMRLVGDDITAFRLSEGIPQKLLLDEEKTFGSLGLN